ncbi:MAG: hypothetical protein ABMA25_26400, partial [Ilumatobacteraceae bacterium]
MNTVDDDIRTLLWEALHDSPTPLAADELSRHVTVMPLNALADRRPRLLVAACLLVIAGLVAGFAVFGRAHDADTPSTNDAVVGTKVGTYYLPAQLPGGYELLSVSEHAGDPAATGSARAVYASAEGARVALRVTPADGRWGTSSESAVLPDGSVQWGSFETPGGDVQAMFQLDLAGTLIDGESLGVATDDLLPLFESVRIDASTGAPEITDVAYTLLASATVANPVVAEWTAIFGKPGAYLGMSELVVRVQRFADPIDVELDDGVWSGTSEINGRTIHGGWMDNAPVWYPEPSLRVAASAYGDSDDETARQTLATMQEVDEAEFEQLVATIETTAETLDVGDSVTFPSGAFVELLGNADDPRGMCLSVGGSRRCDLALME